MKYGRNNDQYRDVEVRMKDWGEIYNHKGVKKQLKDPSSKVEPLLFHLVC